jgi:hypothetical protein
LFIFHWSPRLFGAPNQTPKTILRYFFSRGGGAETSAQKFEP